MNDDPVRITDRAGRTLNSRQLAGMLPDLTRVRPAYRHLAQGISDLIVDGHIALHVKLPAERELAPALGTSRATVTAAYDLLRESGYVRSRRGAGTFAALPAGRRPAAVSRLVGQADAAIDLSTASPGIPADLLTEALAVIGPRLAALAPRTGYNPYGLAELRCAIADRYTARGLPTLPEQILITSGAQQALSLALGLLGGPGDRVVVENPSYTNALEAVRRARLRAVPVPVTDGGWDMEITESAIRQTAPRLAYVIPDFQNPTGCLMPEEQRSRLLRATSRSGTWLIVDETIADIALDVPRPAPTACLAVRGESEQLVTVGSLSKTVWGGLRIGWLRAPARLVTELADRRVTADMSGSVLDQLLALPLLDREDELLATRLDELRERRETLVAALGRHIPEWSCPRPPGGYSLWVDLGEPVAGPLAERAADYGVRIEGGARFGAQPGTFEGRLRIPYALPSATLEEAVRRLAAALAEGLPLAPGRDRPRWVA